MKLPKEYTLGTLVTSNSVQVSSVVEVGNYEEINVNTLNLSCNYSINIPYTKNGTSKVVKYMVNKFDNTAPTIIGTTQISSKDPATEVTTAYISLSGVSDNLSGIKTLKYAEETVALEDAKAYFSNNGIDVIDNKIKIRKYPNYTVYIEDNAGNISVTNISIDVNILAEVE